MIKKIKKCRISNDEDLISILDLGSQYLTGIFPKTKNEIIPKAPLQLVWSKKSNLLQLNHTYPLSKMYGDNYGYRSGLNNSMVKHLEGKIKSLEKIINFVDNDIVIDIGSNDATTLKSYSNKNIKKIGIDPTGNKFKKYYPDEIKLISDFFPSSILNEQIGNKKAKIITSIAMFYDLEEPLSFVKQISNLLDINGIWHLEQSYLPLMLESNAYDTICHEHLEYYSLNNIKEMVEKFNLKIINVETNQINGGSFAVTVAHSKSDFVPNENNINHFLSLERKLMLNTEKPYEEFSDSVFNHRLELQNLIKKLVSDGKKVFGYGASTKGNVLLQFCNLNSSLISHIAEVNEDKFGCFTPGTKIPIISEKQAFRMNPDYFLVLPWHFRDGILLKNKEYMSRGGKFIFPLPKIEII